MYLKYGSSNLQSQQIVSTNGTIRLYEITATTVALFSPNEIQNSNLTYHDFAEMYTLLFK